MAGEHNEDYEDDALLDDDTGDNDGTGEIDSGEGTGESGNKKPAAKGEQDDGSFVVDEEELGGAAEGDTNKVGEEDPKDDEQEKKREARRKERQEQKRRRQERDERERLERESLREQNRQLSERLANIERRNTEGEMAQINEGLTRADQVYNDLRTQHTVALAAGHHDRATEIMEKMLNVRGQKEKLANVKKAFEQRQSAPAPADPRVVKNAQTFMSKNTWYKPEGNDTDSSITAMLDRQVMAEGFDPRTAAYWKALENRIKKYLPHRVAGGKVLPNDTTDDSEDDAPRPTKKKSVVTGSDRGGVSSAPKGGTYKLSPDRVQAMKEAGQWDNPEQRAKMIKYYRDYDKQNGRG